MTEHDSADVERRVRDGEMVSSPMLAALFGRNRSTIYRWYRRGILTAVEDPVSGDLSFDPAAVVALLDRFRDRMPRRV